MTNSQPCRAAGTPKACLEKAGCYLFAIAPAGSELVLILCLEVLIWTA